MLEKESTPLFTYKELATLKEREWLDLQSKGLERSKLGEGKIGDTSIEQYIFDKLRERVVRQEKQLAKEAAIELAEDPQPPAPLSKRTHLSVDRIVDIQEQNLTAALPELRSRPLTDGSKLGSSTKEGSFI